MFGGVPPAAGGVSSRSAANEPTMNNTNPKGGLRLGEDQLKRSSDYRAQSTRPRSPYPFVSTYASDVDTLNRPDVTASFNSKFSLESSFHGERAFDKGQQTSIDTTGEEKSKVYGRDWSDTRSTCSAVSETSSSDTAVLKLHHEAQFAKLLPRNTPLKNAKPTGLRRAFSQKVGISNLIGVKGALFSNRSANSSNPKNCCRAACKDNDDADGQKIHITTTFLTTEADQVWNQPKTHTAILPQRRPKPPVPQGHALEVIQLNLQERILSQITQIAINNAEQDSKSIRGKGKGKIIDKEEEPNEADRELEVTRELMKRIRVALNDGSYEDVLFHAIEGKGHSRSEKQATLCEILLMLRHAFREILVKFSRPYCPTGSPVTDQEVVEEMGAYVIAQKDLHISHPQITLEEVLSNLDVDKDKGSESRASW